MDGLKRWLPHSLVSIAIVAVISLTVDFAKLKYSFSVADHRLLAASLCLPFLGMFVRAKVWQTLLSSGPPYREVLFSTGAGYLLNNVLPFRVGEVGRAFLLSRRTGMPLGKIFPTIVIERITDVAFAATIVLASLPALALVAGVEDAERIRYVVFTIILTLAGVMYTLARHSVITLRLARRCSARWPILQRHVGGFLEAFFIGLGVFRDGWLSVRFFIWMTLDWTIAAASCFLIILAYFPGAQISWALLCLGSATFGGAIPSLPGGVGTYDGAIVGSLTLFTFDQSTALAVALTMRLYSYLNSGVIGGIGLMREGQTVAEIYRQLTSFKRN